MQVQDFNQPAPSIAVPQAPSLPAAAPAAAPAGAGAGISDGDRSGLEIALLKAQIEHLELVVETARSLMTSNQERLLRRLHDLPREMVALTARLNRLDNIDAIREPVRRVA
jgi:hypothetical protein